jgi:hypothetical protein
MNEYAIEFANSIKCVVEGEWADASSDVTLPSTVHGPAEHAIAGLARPTGGMSKVGGCAVQRVSVSAYCTEYFVSSLTCLAAARGGRPARGRFGLTKWFIAPMSRSSSVQLSQRWREKLSCLRMRISLLATQPNLTT